MPSCRRVNLNALLYWQRDGHWNKRCFLVSPFSDKDSKKSKIVSSTGDLLARLPFPITSQVHRRPPASKESLWHLSTVCLHLDPLSLSLGPTPRKSEETP
ncbi:hypothetical protein AUP68_01862 [Ilyonectria robusta]